MDLSVVLLAAGLGTRLRPLTEIAPKCLMPIKGIPLLYYWLQETRSLAPKNILINLHYKSRQVVEFIENFGFSEEVDYSHEKFLLGTAGTIRRNFNQLKGKRVLVAHADNWPPSELPRLIDHHLNRRPRHCLITMLSFDTLTPNTCGMLELNEDSIVTSMVEKPKVYDGTLANGAVYVFEPAVIEWIASNYSVFDLSKDVIPNYFGQIFAVKKLGIHRDIGTITSLQAAQFDEILNITNETPSYIREYRESAAYQKIRDILENYR